MEQNLPIFPLRNRKPVLLIIFIKFIERTFIVSYELIKGCNKFTLRKTMKTSVKVDIDISDPKIGLYKKWVYSKL